MKVSKFKKISPLILAIAFSVFIWIFFVVNTLIAFKKTDDVMTLIIGIPLTLGLGCSTTWDAYCEWRKLKIKANGESLGGVSPPSPK